MIQESGENETKREVDAFALQQAMRNAVRAALRRHMLLGESVAVSDQNGGVRILSPEEIRKALEQG